MDAKSNLIALQNREDFWTEPLWVPDGPSAVLGGRADVFAYFNNDVDQERSGPKRYVMS